MGDVFSFPRTSREIAKLASLRPAPVVDHPASNAFGFPPVDGVHVEGPLSRFMPAETGGAVYVGTARFDRYQVAALAALFSREAARSGDWSLYDALSAARDGLVPEPPEAA